MHHAEVLLKKVLGAAGARDRGYVLTVADEGLEEVPQELRTPHGAWNVVRPKSELDLRHTLWRAGGGAVVALLSRELADALPVDLVRRALSGRVIMLEPLDILRAVLGVPVHGLEDDVILRLAIEHLDQLRAVINERTLPTVIDRRLLDELLLDVCVGSRIRQVESAGKLLAEWLREPPRWTAPVERLVERNLPRLLGPEGRVLSWALEEASAGRAAGALEQIVVRGILMAIAVDELPRSVWGDLERAKSAPVVELDERHLRDVLANLAKDAIAELGSEAAPYLERAETLGRQNLTPGVLGQSVHLKLGLENRCHALIDRMKQGSTVAAEDIEWLRQHRASGMMEAEIALLEEMARLTRWLSTDAEGGSSVHDQVLAYIREGAFADLTAAHLLRALGRTARWHAEAQGLLARWEARRNGDNERFARTLAAKYVDKWHADGVVPLHRIWTEAVLKANFIRRRDGKGGLMLVLLDGCSYPIFVDLVHQLAEQRPPIGVSPPPNARAEGIPALAPLPTITSHARGAVFLGELPNDPWAAELAWRESGERRTDPARFDQNRALGDLRRRLFLKGELDDGGLALREALRDPQLDVVAVVFNAVDDLIGGHATGVVSRLAPAEIHGFLPALDAAFAAGREVVITADHGHTPFLGKDRNVGKGTSARWCRLESGEEPPEGFLEIDVEGLGGPTGRKAFAWKLGAYRGKPHVGFHGGCGLEEVVVPLAWLTRDGVAMDLPAWWYGSERAADDLDYSSLGTPSAPRAPRKRKPSRPRAPQLDLYDRHANQATVVAAANTERLGLSDKVLAALDAEDKETLLLLAENGTATATELARRKGRGQTRLTGYMTKLRRRLFALGVTCFDADSLPTGDVQYTWTGGQNP